MWGGNILEKPTVQWTFRNTKEAGETEWISSGGRSNIKEQDIEKNMAWEKGRDAEEGGEEAFKGHLSSCGRWNGSGGRRGRKGLVRSTGVAAEQATQRSLKGRSCPLVMRCSGSVLPQ